MRINMLAIEAYRLLFRVSPVKTGLSYFAQKLYEKNLKGVANPVRRRARLSAARFPFELDLRDRIQFMMYVRGHHERPTERAFLNMLGPAKCFIDVGANIGYYSLLAARANPALRIFSFEPSEVNCRIFRQNIAKNQTSAITLESAGCSDQNGVAQLQSSDPISESGWNFIGLSPQDAKPYSTEVPITRLDSALERHGRPVVDILKIDVEGHELAVLKGAEKSLSAPGARKVVIEINEACLKSQGTSAAEVDAYLKELGYQPFAVGRRGRLKPVLVPSPREHAECNYVYSKCA